VYCVNACVVEDRQEMYLCFALLRAKVKEPTHRVTLHQCQRYGVGRNMSGGIVRDSCRKADLHGGCTMLAVEAMVGAWLLSLAVGCWLFVVQPTQFTHRSSTQLNGA
jgi:hypothetical protein